MDPSSHYEDVLRRAELFSYIAGLIRTCPEAPPGGEAPVLAALVGGGPHHGVPAVRDLLPRITVIDRRVVCNGLSLDLARRPLTLRLFQAFCSAPDLQLSRDELIFQIYRVRDGEGRSPRYLESVYGNAVKLISRSRILAATGFARGVGSGLEWFVHDQERKMWCLYRIRTQYLVEKMG